MCKSISRELNIFNEWVCVYKLFLNLEKTHFILFTNCKSLKNPVIKINDNVIERLKVTKILGIYINENLSWMDHILATSYQKILQYFTVLASSLIWVLSGILYTDFVILCNGFGKYIYYQFNASLPQTEKSH